MRRGFAPTRERAQADIAAGRVLVGGAPAAKSSRQVGPDEAIVLRGDPPRFVSRGGEKLVAALDRFGIDPRDRRVLDAGASTGGFTDCVLQAGAAGVIAVDVGYGQLHEKVRADPRVVVRDRVNVRHLVPDDVGAPVDLVVADLSFISLALVLGPLVSVCRVGGDLVVLIKPQFEAGRTEVSRGRGIVSDPAVWREVLVSTLEAAGAHGIEVLGLMASPITGTEGNVEFLLHGRPADGPVAPAGAALVEAAVAEAVAVRGHVTVAAVGIVLHSTRPEASRLARDLIAELTTAGHEVRLPAPDADLIGVPDLADPNFGGDLDLAVSLGGDGTMLRTVELVAPSGVPVMGVNVGHLGYLTEVEPSFLPDALERFFAGNFAIEERMLLAVTVVPGAGRGAPVRHLALNEAVVEKTLSGHTVRVDVAIDGAPFTPYAADGLIVATPTGSTAYALSARGPIIAPTHQGLLLIPVSPHMLFDRSLILDPGTELRLTVLDRTGALIVDGRYLGELAPGDGISCTAADVCARLVTFRPRNFHQILKAKFGLNDR